MPWAFVGTSDFRIQISEFKFEVQIGGGARGGTLGQRLPLDMSWRRNPGQIPRNPGQSLRNPGLESSHKIVVFVIV